MKRSEMVKEIISVIATCDPTQPTIETAEQVLTRMELLGILPPQIWKNDPGHFRGDAFSYVINEWEPEDEKECVCSADDCHPCETREAAAKILGGE